MSMLLDPVLIHMNSVHIFPPLSKAVFALRAS